jgi:hypothetical protein
MFEESVHLQDVLLVVALGHDLAGSESLLASLPKEIVRSILAREIEKCYWESRLSIGLLTPTDTSVSRCNQLISGTLPFQDLEFRRAPIPNVVSASMQPKENFVVPFSKSIALKDLTAPTISNFIANRYNDLFSDADANHTFHSTNDNPPRHPPARKVFRRMNDLP